MQEAPKPPEPRNPYVNPIVGFAPFKSGAASMGKMAFVGLLMALLLIPVFMIQDLVRERESNGYSANREVAGKWGANQQVAGPILTIPYRVVTRFGKAPSDTTIEYAHFLPEKLKVSGALEPEIRHRGIYDVALFKADLALEGTFAQPDFSGWRIAPEDILWGDAYVTVSLPDVRSLAAAVPMEWNGKHTEFIPDNYVGSPVVGGLHTRVAVSPVATGGKDVRFAMTMKLNGSGNMDFLPMGKETRISVTSPWRSPSFTGAFLPSGSKVGDTGFNADWNTLHLSRSFPQSWRHQEVTSADWGKYAFGVELLLPVDRYQKTTRCAKYAFLFILLTFLVFFMNETFDKRRIHPLQYLVVGCALCLFYLLLLAFTEHIPFNAAYAIAMAGVVGLITAYGMAVLSSRKRALALGGMLTGLYAYLFTLLQMEDFALLTGAIGLFVILSGVMYLTRKLNLAAPVLAAEAV